MKSHLLVISFLMLAACARPTDHVNHTDENDGDDPNRALYDQVMAIHDEVMPKMEDIYNLKKELADTIANTPDMVEAKKKELEAMMARLDSANDAMMGWMHEFNPLPDSADQEKARAYLENEMEKIRKVKDLTAESIEKAKAIMKEHP
jgi:Mg2+ and Co2+ transporter CorA